MTETKFLTQLSKGDIILDKNDNPALMVVSFYSLEEKLGSKKVFLQEFTELECNNIEEAIEVLPTFTPLCISGFIVEDPVGSQMSLWQGNLVYPRELQFWDAPSAKNKNGTVGPNPYLRKPYGEEKVCLIFVSSVQLARYIEGTPLAIKMSKTPYHQLPRDVRAEVDNTWRAYVRKFASLRLVRVE